MKRTRHGDYFIQLTHWPYLFPVNLYLVREEDGFTLIDTATRGCATEILAAAVDLGAPITRIALTHYHGDHVGALHALVAALPGVAVLMSSRTAQLLSGHGATDPVGGPATRLLAPGDRVGSLEVLASPGHSPDHIAFLDRRDRTLIAGDAFQTQGGVAVAGTIRPLFPFVAMGTADKTLALESARALRATEPARLAVGHGRVLDDPCPAMDRAIAVAERGVAGRLRQAG